MKKSFVRIAGITTLALVLTGCFNPFDESSLSGGDAGMGSVTISLSSSLSASSSGAMVPAVAVQIATYEIVFTSDPGLAVPDGPVVSDITDTTQPITVEVPPGTWVVYANGYRTTGELAARSPEQTVTVTENASQELPQPLIVSPRQIEGTTGAALLDVTVPDGTISEVVNVTLVARDGQTVPSPIPGFDLTSSTTLSWSMTGLPVGSYYLSAELRGPDGRGNIQTRSYLNVALEVFTNLASRYVSAVDGSDGLIIGESQISSPPEALTGLTVEVSPSYLSDASDPPNAQINLSWTTSSVTASGFRVYVDGVDTVPLNFIDFGGAFNVPVPAGQPVSVDVVAYNGFGESAPVNWTGTVPAQPAVVSPLNGVYVAPGTVTLEWNAAAGAESYVVGVGEDQFNPDQEFTVPATQTSFDFTEGFAGVNYYWYVFAVNSSVNGRVVNSNTADGFFRIRDGVYVSAAALPGGDGGSPSTPFQTLSEGIAAAVAGETIKLAGAVNGSIYEGGIAITKPLTIDGNWDTTFTNQSTGTETTIISPAAGGHAVQVQSSTGPVTLRNLRIALNNTTGTSYHGVYPIFSSGLIIEDAVLEVEDTAASVGAALYVTNSAGDVTVRRSTISAGASTIGKSTSGIFVVGTYPDTLTIGGTAPSDGNTFLSRTSADTVSHIRQGTGSPSLTPNIVVQNNTFQNLTGSNNTWMHSIYAQGDKGNYSITDNTFAGHSNTGSNTVWNIRIAGASATPPFEGAITISGNTFDLVADTDSPESAIQLAAGTQFAIVSSNRIRAKGAANIATRTVTGIATERPTDIFNNVIIHETGGGGSGAFRGVEIGATASSSRVLHNTIVYEAGSTTPSLIYLNGTDASIVATNNVFVGDNATNGIFLTGGTAAPGEVNANIFSTAITNAYNPGTAQDVASLNSQSFAAGNVSVEPQLDSTNNYAPLGSTPVELRAGGDPSYLGVVPTDYTGTTERTAPVSIGAYEVDQPGDDVAQFALQGEWLLSSAALTDSSGNGYDGFPNELVATGGGPQPTADRKSVANEAGALAGDTGFELTTSSLPLGDFSGGKTFSYWITQPTTNGRVIGQRYDNAPSTWEQDWLTDELRFGYAGSTTAWTALAISTSTPGWTAGWNHIALVVDTIGGTVATYLNGSPVGSADIGTADFVTDNPIRIGATGLPGATFSFDDLRIYNRALLPSEIAGLAAE